MTKEQLAQRRLELIAALSAIGQAPLDTPAGHRREEVIADLRNVNAAIKQANIEEARAAKSEADKRKARGIAEHVANLQRAGVELPASALTKQPASMQTPGEFVLSLAKRLRKQLRRFKTPASHTLTFLPLLTEFIDEQEAMLVGYDAKPSSPDEWAEIWDEPWIDPSSDKL